MNSERFLQPLVEHLLLYVGLDQTLAYVSTCKEYRKERKWLIEQHAVVDHRVAEQFTGGISIKYRSATAERVGLLKAVASTLTHLTFRRWFNVLPTLTPLTFRRWFNQPLDNVTLPPSLTHLTFGRHFDEPLDKVTLPPTLTHLTFGYHFNRPLDNVTLPSTLTLSEQYNRSLDCLPSHVTVTRQ